MECILERHPEFFLGRINPLEVGIGPALDMFGLFWSAYKDLQPDHPIFDRTEAQRRRTIPILLHGDEGRGLSKDPLLVIAFQVMIPSSGIDHLNCSQHFD